MFLSEWLIECLSFSGRESVFDARDAFDGAKDWTEWNSLVLDAKCKKPHV